MLQDFKNNPNKFHFLAYSASYLFYGAIITGIGPLIPYLAQIQHVDQTQFKFFFLARTIGFVAGAICIKLMENKISFHNILIIFSTLIFVSFALFSYASNMMMQGIYLFFASVFSSMVQIILNVAVLVSQARTHQQFYMQMAHSMFGIGGLLSPFVVLIFQEFSYFYISLMMFFVAPAYYMLQTPQRTKQKKAEQIFEAGNIVDQIKRIQHRISSRKQQKNQLIEKKTLIIYLICFLMFLYIGQQVAFGGWISSYAILQGISTKQEATVYSSIFWASITFMRILLAFINMKPSKKIKLLISFQIFFMVVTLVIIQVVGQLKFAAYFASVTIGMSVSALFGLFFVLPTQFGIQMTAQQSSSFALYGQVGQGAIGMFVGYLMSWFSPNMLHYSVLFCAVLMLITCNKIINILTIQKQTNPNYQDMNFIHPQLKNQNEKKSQQVQLIEKNIR